MAQQERLRATHDLQVQLLVKQGQVEIGNGGGGIDVLNFGECLLIDRA